MHYLDLAKIEKLCFTRGLLTNELHHYAKISRTTWFRLRRAPVAKASENTCINIARALKVAPAEIIITDRSRLREFSSQDKKASPFSQYWWLLIIFPISAGIWYYNGTSANSNIVCCEISQDRSTFFAINSKGNKLWSHYTGSILPYLSEPYQPYLVADIDDDRKNEVLYATSRKLNESGKIACLDSKGNLKWEYQFFETVYDFEDANYEYGPIMVLPDLESPRIIVLARHHYFPGLVIGLTKDGKVTGIYRHPGHMNHILAIKKDGIDAVVVGGIANWPRPGIDKSFYAAVALLDPQNLNGSCCIYSDSLAPAHPELAYIRIPKPFDDGDNQNFPKVEGLELELFGAEECIRAAVIMHRSYKDEFTSLNWGQYYHFSKDLKPLNVQIGQTFIPLCEYFKRTGKNIDYNQQKLFTYLLDNVEIYK